jgi:hypothetical protein
MADRTSKPSAQKRGRAAVQFDEAARGIKRLLGSDSVERAPTEEIPAIPVSGTGVERPVPEWVDVTQRLQRDFAFVDISGFTSYMDAEGSEAAVELLTRFRMACRDVSGRRGVRMAKWLGDGVMVVATEPGPLVAAVGELMLRMHGEDIDVHAGIASGTVLLFEGDDYIGRPVNIAARLCDAAGPGEALYLGEAGVVPDWVDVSGPVTVRADGLGDIGEISLLRVTDDAWATSGNSGIEHHPSSS